jgi:hypothetical protein
VRPYLGPRSYHDGNAGSVVSLQPWRTPAREPAARPQRASGFSVDRSGLAGSIEAMGMPFGDGNVVIKGSWHCLPTA